MCKVGEGRRERGTLEKREGRRKNGGRERGTLEEGRKERETNDICQLERVQFIHYKFHSYLDFHLT
jgi:hypothetical protein